MQHEFQKHVKFEKCVHFQRKIYNYLKTNYTAIQFKILCKEVN